MFRSPDGYSLTYPASRVAPLLAKLVGLGHLTLSQASGANGPRFLDAALRSLVASSWPVATPDPGKAPGSPSRFFAFLGDSAVTLRTRALSWNRHAILDIEPRAEEEAEVPREGKVGVVWNSPTTLDRARRVGGGGLYILEKTLDSGKTWIPDYVGQTKDYDRRLAVHGRTRAASGPTAQFRVRLGHVADLKPPANLTTLSPSARADQLRKLRLTTEHGVIRSLLRAGFNFLSNRSSIRPLMPVSTGLSVQHIGGPAYLAATQARAASLYEAEAPWQRL
jgi:hypothetical protein